MIDIESKARQKFQDRLTKGLLGPGSDTWGVPEEEEVISDYPLIRYFTGVLFPSKAAVNSQLEDDIAEVENQANENEELQESHIGKESEDELNSDTEQEIKEKDEELKISQNNFFPTNMGLTICIDNSVKELDVEFSFGSYYQPSYKEKRIRISEAGYLSLIDEKIPAKLSFSDKLKYDGEYMYLDRELDGFSGGKNKSRSGDYRSFDEFKGAKNLVDSPAKYFKDHLEKLISRSWKRKAIIIKKRIITENSSIPIRLDLPDGLSKEFSASYNIKTYIFQGRKYVKVQFVNSSKPHPRNRFSNKNEKLNSKCMFQSKISIATDKILPYKKRTENFTNDEEAEQLNFVFRNIHAFGIGHNCAAQWDTPSI